MLYTLIEINGFQQLQRIKPQVLQTIHEKICGRLTADGLS